MEFKGTKGKWVSNGNNVLIDEYSRQIQLEYNCGGFGIEREYNALLISKAPEMLEMLKDSVEVIKWYMENSATELHEPFFNIGANQIEQTEQLIKEATEI